MNIYHRGGLAVATLLLSIGASHAGPCSPAIDRMRPGSTR
jgi:hypothetical protein